MQHQIDAEKLGPSGPAMAGVVQSCVHCGLCLSACPTYQVLGEEMDSPRGRIYLMKYVLEGELPAADAQPYLDRCLGCWACVPACPSGVAYGELLTHYRAATANQRQASWRDAATRKMLVETLPYPGRFRKAVAAGRIGRAVQRLLPDAWRGMLDLLPAALPQSDPLPDMFPARTRRRARVALLTGCVQSVLAPEINWATLRVLAHNGVETIVPSAQGCCGAILMHLGEHERARQLARHNMQVFPQDVDAILTNAAGCGSGMHDYQRLFAGAEDQAAAEAFSACVQDVSVFLDQLGLEPPGPLPVPLRVAYHDACHLLHAQGVRDQPRRLLGRIPNVELLELNDGGMCCGSAGVYNLLQPEIARQLGDRKVARILDTGADAVVTGNLGCLTQIQAHLRRLSQDLPVYHTMTLLERAYSASDD
ncbi:MAG: glycolate oxidase subunit GlcF [Pirellulaceae bacterium]|nr:glycolate oxidase subunit GlcF [Pirellulaceae bacterium]